MASKFDQKRDRDGYDYPSGMLRHNDNFQVSLHAIWHFWITPYSSKEKVINSINM